MPQTNYIQVLIFLFPSLRFANSTVHLEFVKRVDYKWSHHTQQDIVMDTLANLTVVTISQYIQGNIGLYALNTIFICQLCLSKAEIKPHLTKSPLF